MHRHYVLLISLAVVSLLLTVDAETTSSKFPVGARSLDDDQVEAAAKRSLRGEPAIDKGEDIGRAEERGLVLPGVVQKVTDLAKSIAQNIKTRVWRFRMENKFRSQKLESFSNSEMKKWAESVTKLNKRGPKSSAHVMLNTLTKHYDEMAVMRWAHAAKDSSEMGAVGQKIQSAAFWKLMYRGYDALGVAKRLRTTAGGDSQQDKHIVQAFALFVKRYNGLA